MFACPFPRKGRAASNRLGRAGDVKKVANGFGRNYLLPQGLAVLATPGALKQAETIRKSAEKHRAREMEDAQAISNQLAGIELLFERRAGETGKLYGSVTSGDIATAIQERTGIELDKRKVALPEPIRNLGKQEVVIKLMIDLSTTIGVEVLPLGGILERERLTEAEAAKLEAEAEADLDTVEETVPAQVSEIEGEEAEAEVEVEIEAEPDDTAEPDTDSEDVESETEESKDTE